MTFCLLFLLAFFGDSVPEAHAGKDLSVAVLQNYPPFSYTDEHGNLVGFDVEFAEALCGQLHAQCRTVALPLRAIVAGLASQSLDIAVAGLGVTEERGRIMLFSNSYYRSHSFYIGRPGIRLDEEGLEGKILAAQHNSVQLIALRRIWQGKAVVVSFESHQGLLDALVIAPCTGNTLTKLALGITDTAVTMAAKSTLRNERPVLLALSTNDALGGSAKNIGVLQTLRNYYFVPYGQDDADGKPRSCVARMELIDEALAAALQGRQLQPVIRQ